MCAYRTWPSPARLWRLDRATLSDPVLVIEILSPSNQAKTWTNVWAYTSIPSVREILVLRADRIAAELLRRSPQGEWPDRPIAFAEGELSLESIGFRVALAELYSRTGLGALKSIDRAPAGSGLRYSEDVAKNCPLRPLAGEREGTHRVSDGEGEVGDAADRGLPHLTPTLSAPWGGEGEESLCGPAVRRAFRE
jgi:hypothetical protein